MNSINAHPRLLIRQIHVINVSSANPKCAAERYKYYCLLNYRKTTAEKRITDEHQKSDRYEKNEQRNHLQRSSMVATNLPPSRHKQKLLKQLRILLILEHCTIQRGQHLALIFLAQHGRINVLREQQLDPVNQLAS